LKAETIITLLKTPLFAGIGKEDLANFLLCLNPRVQEFEKGEYIGLEGQALKGIGCVLSGEIAIIKETVAGDRNILTVVKPGSLFGEMAAWSVSPKWPATVQALENASVLFLPPDKIAGSCAKACRWHTVIIENMLRILAQKALMLNKKVEYLAMKTMRGKLSAYILENARSQGSTTFALPLNRNELADYLGVSRPSMSREMGRMRDEGIIDYHLATVKIKDINLLKESVE
jgi:CRP/FNR family transcriptional regulator, dissimilatory nitrate respiration regulator